MTHRRALPGVDKGSVAAEPLCPFCLEKREHDFVRLYLWGYVARDVGKCRVFQWHFHSGGDKTAWFLSDQLRWLRQEWLVVSGWLGFSDQFSVGGLAL